MEKDVMQELMNINARAGVAFGRVGRDIRSLRRSNSRKNLVIAALAFVVYGLMKNQDEMRKEINALKGDKEM